VNETQVFKEENRRLNDLLSMRDKELNKLEESVSVLRQQVQGQILFICTLLMH